VRERVKEALQQGQHTSQTELIRTLNPILRGLVNYYRHVVSKVVFQILDHQIWRSTWNRARGRHTRKSRRWVKDRHFPHQGMRKKVFSVGYHTLASLAYIPIRRHVHLRIGTNPYDPMDADYFAQRRAANRAFPSLWVHHPIRLATFSPTLPGASRRLLRA